MYASDIMISSFFFKMEGVRDPNRCGVEAHVFVESSSVTRVDVDFML